MALPAFSIEMRNLVEVDGEAINSNLSHYRNQSRGTFPELLCGLCVLCGEILAHAKNENFAEMKPTSK
jgi:hypothetical protein